MERILKRIKALNVREILGQVRGALLKRQLIQNIILVASISLFVKVIGFYKESVVAGEFGLSQQLDTFYISQLIPGFITSVFLSSFNRLFIPNYVMEMRTGNNMSSFQSTGFLAVTAASSFFLLFAILLSDVYLQNFFPGHTADYYAYVKQQFYVVSPCIIIWGWSQLLSGLLNINNEFKYSSFNTIFTPIVTIIFIFFFKDFFGKVVLSAGILFGGVLNFLFLLSVAIRRKIISFGKPDFKNENAVLMFKQLPAKTTSSFLTGLLGVTDQYFAAQLAIGSIAALNYGLKIPAFITGLSVLAMNNVLLPYFSKKVAKNKSKAFEELFKMLKWLFLGFGVVTIIAIFSSQFWVQLFFERKEFTSEHTEVVSIIQQIRLVYIPFVICEMVLVNFLTSINKNTYMAWNALICVILNVVLDYIGMKLYGVYGISIATTIVYISRSLVLYSFTLKEKNLLSKV